MEEILLFVDKLSIPGLFHASQVVHGCLKGVQTHSQGSSHAFVMTGCSGFQGIFTLPETNRKRP